MIMSLSGCTSQSVHLGSPHFQRSEDRKKQGKTKMAE